VLSASDIARGMQGALLFLRRDPGAPSYFENTIEACLRSFRVMTLAAPFYAVYVWLRYTNVDTSADAFEIIMVEAMRFLVDWLLFPVLFHEIARRRRWLDNFPRYISALNWIGLPALILQVVGFILILQLPDSIGMLIDAVMQVLFFYWFLITTRLSLAISWPLSILLLVVNWVPSLLLLILVNRVLGVMPLPGG
jgi:hypothetical protein